MTVLVFILYNTSWRSTVKMPKKSSKKSVAKKKTKVVGGLSGSLLVVSILVNNKWQHGPWPKRLLSSFILVHVWCTMVKEVLYDDLGVFYLSVTLCSKQNSRKVLKREWTYHSLTKNIKVCDCTYLSVITP